MFNTYTGEVKGREFKYHPHNGELYMRRDGRWVQCLNLDKDGYIVVYFGRTRLTAGRIAACLMDEKLCYDNRKWVIVHMNWKTGDIRWSNLRVATHSQKNYHRRKLKGYYSSDHKGVSGKYVYAHGRLLITKPYTVSVGGKYQGSFKHEQDAAVMYNLVAEEIAGEFAVLNNV